MYQQAAGGGFEPRTSTATRPMRIVPRWATKAGNGYSHWHEAFRINGQ